MKQVSAKHAVIFALAACVFGVAVGSALTVGVLRVKNVAQVKAVGVEIYADSDLTESLNEINWGLIAPGESKTFTAYIRNAGNAPITLSLRIEDWVPVNASSVMQVLWDYSGETVDAGQAVTVQFELRVDPAVAGIDNFNFTMVITGSG